MAKYDRRILIPYLRDVCCVEMLCQKLEQDIQHARSESANYAYWANQEYKDPEAPSWENYAASNSDLIRGIIMLIVFGGPGLLLLGFFPVLGIIGIGLGVLMFMLEYKNQQDSNEIAEKIYYEKVKEYKQECATQKSYRESKSMWRENAQQWKNQENDLIRKLREAKALRNRVYSVNIIPARYRNIHAAYYLYDFFSTCRETDLEKTIQTMLLDEIIQKMDELIRQNQEIILNQRMQMAMQERQNRDIAENHRQEMKRLASMERNQELQMDYQNMIARNQEVTNFFLAADYLRKR